jgi:hypothetical protein
MQSACPSKPTQQLTGSPATTSIRLFVTRAALSGFALPMDCRALMVIPSPILAPIKGYHTAKSWISWRLETAHIGCNKGRPRSIQPKITAGASGDLRKIEFRFESPVVEDDTKISSDVRREVFLIFKEAVNNIIRHSECTLAEISLRSESGLALLRVSDDGRGFDVDRADWGQGLASIRKRAANVGAELVLVSSPGHGATILVKAPLK